MPPTETLATADEAPAPSGDALLTAILASTPSKLFLVEVGAANTFRYISLSGERRVRRTPTDAFEPAEARAVERRYRECLSAGHAIVYEEQLRGRWWQTSLTPLPDVTGRIERLLGVAIDITERKEVETRLDETAQQFASIAENVPGMVYRRVLHPDGRITYPFVSSGVATLFGFPAEQVMQNPGLLLGTISPKDRDRFDIEIARSARDGSSYDIELRSIVASGEEKWLRSIAKTSRRAEGSIVWDGIILDISDRKGAQAEAAAASSRLLGAVEALTEAVAVFDDEDRLVLCNARFREISSGIADLLVPGATFEALIRASVSRGRFQEAIGREEEWITDRMSRHRAASGSFEQQLADRWLQVLEQRTPEGGVILLATDITEVKRRQEAMTLLAGGAAEEQGFLSTAALSLRRGLGCRWAGVCRMLPGGKRAEVLAWVDGDAPLPTFAYDLAGTPCADLLENGNFFVVPSGIVERYPDDAELAQMGAESYIGAVLRDVRGRVMGHVFGISDRPDPTASSKRDLMGLVAARVGLELQRLEAERQLVAAKEHAELASRAKSDFLANMSNELRTPLNAVIGFSQMIAQEILGPVGRREYADYARDIQSSSMHLLELISDILDVSKVEAGMMSLRPAPTDIPAVINACCRLMQPRAAEAKVTLVSEVTENLAVIIADETMVKQIALNLLSNAVKFTPEGGEVRVRADWTKEGGVEIVVSDTGIGIDPGDIERVLRPFGQVETALTRRFPGTGLGLPLSKRLAELHGGTLTLESSLGRGTTATVFLPPTGATIRPDKSFEAS
jgi:PAS domain S-box-containing protein